MGNSFKLYFKYILLQLPYTFVYFNAQKKNVINIFITNNTLLYLMLHVKMSSLFYSSQLADIFAYELPLSSSLKNENTKNYPIVNMKTLTQPSVVVYNLHSMLYHKRLFIFTQHNHLILDKKLQNNNYSLNSISEIFPAGN